MLFRLRSKKPSKTYHERKPICGNCVAILLKKNLFRPIIELSNQIEVVALHLTIVTILECRLVNKKICHEINF